MNNFYPLACIALAALAFAIGGICMKLSAGLTQWPASLGVFLLFTLGAGLQALAMTRGDLGAIYIAVLGLEAVLAFGFGVVLFHEPMSPGRLLAVTLVVAGIACLR